MSANSLKMTECTPSSAEQLREFTDKQLRDNGVPVEFPDQIGRLREGDFATDDSSNRVDLRNLTCITIDCDDTQDMDDACSLEETPSGFRLGIHIADVASYVTPGSPLDDEAMNRGTSIYLPDRTIPMLPSVLSNNLCSLNPNEDRRAISVLIDLDCAGDVKGYAICKSLIRSSLKGSYSEANDVLDGSASPTIAQKYSLVAPMLRNMAVLAGSLRIQRIKRGADVCDDGRPKIIIDSDSIELERVGRGIAEKAIEEFMVLCNRLVGDYLELNGLPGIYRTQARQGDLAEYEPAAKRHASLGISGYVHFTSPIRRMPDLKIHQCLTMHLEGASPDEIMAVLGESIGEDSEVAVKRSRRAKNIEHACRKLCYSLYFEDHPGCSYTGRVVGADRSGNALLEVDDLRISVLAPRGRKLIEGYAYSFMVSVRGLKRVTQAYAVRRAKSCTA